MVKPSDSSLSHGLELVAHGTLGCLDDRISGQIDLAQSGNVRVGIIEYSPQGVASDLHAHRVGIGAVPENISGRIGSDAEISQRRMHHDRLTRGGLSDLRERRESEIRWNRSCPERKVRSL